MAGMEDIVGKTGNYNMRDKFKRFDNKFIRPLVLKHIQVRDNKIPYLFLFLIINILPDIPLASILTHIFSCG